MRLRVLLVEDEPAVARLAARMLSVGVASGLDVAHVEELREALRRLGEEYFDVVVLDLDLPDSHGLDTLARLRAGAPEVPVVVLSGGADEDLSAEMLRRGAQECFLKGQVDWKVVARVLPYAIERKRNEEYLTHLARRDPLTSLPNRLLLLERLGQALALARRGGHMLAVMILDLDGFKTINDTLGHTAGDALIQGVGERLAACTREGDTVSRFGGDEFTILLPRVGHATDVAAVAAKILSVLEPPFSLYGHELFVSASIGASVFPADGQDADALLRNADAAMYRAKREGGAQHQLYSSALNAAAAERLSLHSGLRRALEREEFVLHFQPQVAAGTGRIVGAEALIRWDRPGHGLVPPSHFIGFAEETGLIQPIGEWVLAKACAEARAWRDAGFGPVRISVNVSNRQLGGAGLREAVARALEASGIEPSGLDLELTESGLMMETGPVLDALEFFRSIGVRISIDDFGTGYSSLSRLRRLPIDTVKIDQSFVSESADGNGGSALVRAIIQMSHGLGLGVIAEGVETAAQSEFLTEMGCDEMQGFLFGKPVPAESFVRMLRERRLGPLRDVQPPSPAPA